MGATHGMKPVEWNVLHAKWNKSQKLCNFNTCCVHQYCQFCGTDKHVARTPHALDSSSPSSFSTCTECSLQFLKCMAESSMDRTGPTPPPMQRPIAWLLWQLVTYTHLQTPSHGVRRLLLCLAVSVFWCSSKWLTVGSEPQRVWEGSNKKTL